MFDLIPSALAIELNYPDIPGFGDLNDVIQQPISFPQVVQFVFASALWLGATFAFLTLLWAGFQFALSAGNPGKRREVQDRLAGIVFGILMLLTVYLVLRAINPDLIFLNARNNFAICKPQGVIDCNNPFFPNIGGGGIPSGATCIGPNSFESASGGTTLQQMADIICTNEGKMPTKTVVGEHLTNVVGAENCTQTDVDAVYNDLLTATPCGTTGPPGSTVGGIAINGSTVPEQFCSYSLTLHTQGAVYGPYGGGVTTITFIAGTSNPDDYLPLITENTNKLATYCQSKNDTACILKDADKTNIGTLTDEQLTALANYCTDILPEP